MGRAVEQKTKNAHAKQAQAKPYKLVTWKRPTAGLRGGSSPSFLSVRLLSLLHGAKCE